MRRWIAIFLLALLPFQAIWAAVEPYCLHESAQSAASVTHHLGHHEHRHHAEAKSGQPAQADGHLSPADAMADHDHHCCATVSLLPAGLPWSGPVPLREVAAAPLAAYVSADASGIDRPNWSRSL